MALSETANILVRVSAVNAASATLNQVNQQFGELRNTVLKVGAAIAGAFAFRDVIDSTRRLGDEIDLLRDNLGLTAEQASVLNYAARTVGSSAEEVSQSFGLLNRKLIEQAPLIAQGKSDFDKWGVSVRGANGQILPFQQVIENVSEKLSALPPGFQRSGLAMDLMGRSGRQLIDLLTLSKEQVAALAKEADEFGLILSDAGVNNLEDFNRQMNRLNLQFDGMKLQIGSFLLPILRAALQGVRNLAGGFKVLAEAMRTPLGIIKEIFDRLGKFVAQIKEQGFFNALVNLAKDIMVKIGEVLGNVGNWIRDHWPEWVSALGEFTKNTTRWFVGTFIPAFLAELPGWLIRFADWMGTEAIPRIAGALATFGVALIQGIADGMNDIGTRFLPKIQAGLMDAINRTLPPEIAIPLKFLIVGTTGEFLDPFGWRTQFFNFLKEKIGEMRVAVKLELDGEFLDPFGWRTALFNMLKGAVGGASSGGSGQGVQRPEERGGFTGTPASSMDRPATLDDMYSAYVRNHGTTPSDSWYAHANSMLAMGPMWSEVQGMARGGIVMPRPGGTLARLGEAGRPEAVVPLGSGGMGNTFVFNIGSVDSAARVREVAKATSDEIMRKLGHNRALSF